MTAVCDIAADRFAHVLGFGRGNGEAVSAADLDAVRRCPAITDPHIREAVLRALDSLATASDAQLTRLNAAKQPDAIALSLGRGQLANTAEHGRDLTLAYTQACLAIDDVCFDLTERGRWSAKAMMLSIVTQGRLDQRSIRELSQGFRHAFRWN